LTEKVRDKQEIKYHNTLKVKLFVFVQYSYFDAEHKLGV